MYELGMERVQACILANISRYVAIAAQLAHQLQIRTILHNNGASPTTPPKLHPGPCNSVGMGPRTDRHIDAYTHRRAWPRLWYSHICAEEGR